MKPQEPDFSQHSRLAQHLSILDLDANRPKIDTAAEAQAIGGMQPLPLQLPLAAKKKNIWYLTPLVLAAAAVLLILFKEPKEENWSMKGAGNVQVYVEQDGQVKALQDAGPLQPSARIQAEVLATAPVLAFWGVSSGEGLMLQDFAWIWDHRLQLQPLEKKFFQGSLQLEGPSEGESLCVVICPLELAGRFEEPDIREDLLHIISSKARLSKGLTACTPSCFALRP